MHSKLPLHEWVIIVLLIVTLASIAGVALIRHPSSPPITEEEHELLNKNVVVDITGAVEKPGVYELPKGSLYKDLLSKAIPQPHADLRKIKMQALLKDGQFIHIPSEIWITIYIEGAVLNPGPKEVLAGTTLSELSEELAYSDQADRQKIQKKRKVKEGEVIRIPTLRKARAPAAIKGNKKKVAPT